MTVGNVTIEPIKDLKNWYRLTFTSRRDGIGQTKVEMLVSEETLRMIRLIIDKTLKEQQSHE